MKLSLAAILLMTGAAFSQTSPSQSDACNEMGPGGIPRQYVVYLKQGSVLTGRSALCRDPQVSSAMRLRIDGRAVYPYETDSIFEEGVRGIPAPGSTAWAFPVMTGRIRVYAARSARGLADATALSKDAEPLVRYNLKNLEDRMRDDSTAMGLIRRRRNAGVMSGLMGVGGVALAFIGGVTSVEEVPDGVYGDTKSEFHPNILFFAGIGLFIGSWFVPSLLTADNPQRALEHYNARFAADSSGAHPAQPPRKL